METLLLAMEIRANFLDLHHLSCKIM